MRVYLLLKVIHIASVIAFLGNITTGLYWHAHAARTRDPGRIAHVVDGIIRSDRFFTMPGVLGIILTGVAMAMVGHLPILGTHWIAWTLLLFAISGVIFVGVVAPLQVKMRAAAQAGEASKAFDLEAYRALTRRWELWGALAIAAPLAGLALMVLKPAL